MSEPCKCLPGYFNDVLADHQDLSLLPILKNKCIRQIRDRRRVIAEPLRGPDCPTAHRLRNASGVLALNERRIS
jgi:hypothetical protein